MIICLRKGVCYEKYISFDRYYRFCSGTDIVRPTVFTQFQTKQFMYLLQNNEFDTLYKKIDSFIPNRFSRV